jgi:hypothetical protein
VFLHRRVALGTQGIEVGRRVHAQNVVGWATLRIKAMKPCCSCVSPMLTQR